MIGCYPPLNDSSGLTWDMFTHVVEINIAFTIFMFMVDYILLMLALNVGYSQCMFMIVVAL